MDCCRQHQIDFTHKKCWDGTQLGWRRREAGGWNWPLEIGINGPRILIMEGGFNPQISLGLPVELWEKRAWADRTITFSLNSPWNRRGHKVQARSFWELVWLRYVRFLFLVNLEAGNSSSELPIQSIRAWIILFLGQNFNYAQRFLLNLFVHTENPGPKISPFIPCMFLFPVAPREFLISSSSSFHLRLGLIAPHGRGWWRRPKLRNELCSSPFLSADWRKKCVTRKNLSPNRCAFNSPSDYHAQLIANHACFCDATIVVAPIEIAQGALKRPTCHDGYNLRSIYSSTGCNVVASEKLTVTWDCAVCGVTWPKNHCCVGRW